MRGRVGPVLACAVTYTLLVACGGSDPSMFQQKSIKVGTKNNQPGTSEEDANHTWQGLDVLLAYQLTKKLGSTPYFSDVASEQRESALVNNADDLVIATYSITQPRTAQVDFAGPYAVTLQGFMIRAGETWLTKLDDLKGRTVCSWGGTTSFGELSTAAKIKGFILVEKEDAEGCRQELVAQPPRVDAVSTDQLLLYGLTEGYPGLAVVPDVTIGSKNYYGIGIRKGRRGDCRKIRDFLRSYVTSSDWTRDFQTTLSAISRPGDFRPDPADIDRMSCVDQIK